MIEKLSFLFRLNNVYWLLNMKPWIRILESTHKAVLDLILRLTKAPLFAESMVMIEPKIIFWNLNVLVLILDPISKNDPFPFEKENNVLQKQHPNLIEHVFYQDTQHNMIYEKPNQFVEDVVAFLKKVKVYNKINWMLLLSA